jgi:oligo-1,6-glucosidase
MERKWWKEGVVYQIYPRSFYDSNGDGIGDIRGIIEKLDYLKKLGIDIIWLNPVYGSPNDDNGYDISHYQQIMAEFGTMEDIEELLEKMHQREMKLIMDLVVNHTSDEHPWFIESRESKDNPYRDYYIWRKGKDRQLPNNWRSWFSGPVWEYDEITDEYYMHLFSKKQPDLNWENEKVRQEVYNMMTWWLDKGIDGFRMDVINAISKVKGLPDGEGKVGEDGLTDGSKYFTNGPRIHEFLQEMNKKVLSKYDVMTVGETANITTEHGILYTGEERNELNMVFHFEHMDLGYGEDGKWTPVPWKLTELKKIMTKWQLALHNKGWNSLYLNNHDQARMVSRFGNDTIYRKESAKMLATFLHTLQGTPYIYQGEEIGMTNVHFDDIHMYKDVEIINKYKEIQETKTLTEEQLLQGIHAHGRDNARTPMQWNTQKNAGFTTGEPWLMVNPNHMNINVEESLADPDSVFYYYQKLLKLRREHLIMVYGKYELLLEDDEQIYAYTRSYNDEKWLVILNFSKEQAEFVLPSTEKVINQSLIISNYEVDEKESIDAFMLRPYEARVYRII